MYLDFYRFREEPFHITTDPAFLYLSPSHKEALGAIIYGISQKKGFVAISGEVGVGKTTILRAYLDGADLSANPDSQKVIYLFNANIPFIGLLHTLCRELDKEPPAGEAYEVVNFLHAVLIQEYRQGNTVVLVIDEIQNMPQDTLENLRMLSNLETSQEKLIQIVMVGQPEFDARLNSPQLRQLNQRIAIRARIRPLTRKESLEYLYHRLSRVTNAPQTAFTPSALRLIARSAAGAPRTLNILSDNALIAGFGYHKKPVTPGIVRETIVDYRGHKTSSKMLQWLLVPVALALLIAGLLLTPAGREMLSRAEAMIRPLLVRVMTKGSAPSGVRPLSLAETADPADAVSSMPFPAMYPVPKPRPEGSEKKSLIAPTPKTVASEAPSQPEPRVVASVPEPTASEPLTMKPPDVPSKEAKAVWHVVRKGDTLFYISQATYGIYNSETLKWILASNPQIQDPNILVVGETLLLPDRLTSNQ